MEFDKTHILLGIGVVLLALFGVYAIEARIADRAESKAELAVQHATDLAKQNADFQAATQLQIAALNSALNARQTVELKIPPQNGSYTPSQVATQVTSDTQGKLGSATVVGDNVVFPLPLAQLALSDIQLIPLLTQDKADLSKQLDLEKQAHVSDIQSCQSQTLAAKAETKVAVAKGRKSFLKGFFIGAVAGFIGRGAI